MPAVLAQANNKEGLQLPFVLQGYQSLATISLAPLALLVGCKQRVHLLQAPTASHTQPAAPTTNSPHRQS